jgi:hypothetical protein
MSPKSILRSVYKLLNWGSNNYVKNTVQSHIPIVNQLYWNGLNSKTQITAYIVLTKLGIKGSIVGIILMFL